MVSSPSLVPNQRHYPMILSANHPIVLYFDKKLQLMTLSSSYFHSKIITPLIIRYPFHFQRSYFVLHHKDWNENNFMMRMAKCGGNINSLYPFPYVMKRTGDSDINGQESDEMNAINIQTNNENNYNNLNAINTANNNVNHNDTNNNQMAVHRINEKGLQTGPKNVQSYNFLEYSRKMEDPRFKVKRYKADHSSLSRALAPSLHRDCVKSVMRLIPRDAVQRQLKDEVNSFGFTALMNAFLFQYDIGIIRLFAPKHPDFAYWEIVEPNV
ncbi:hypothetical protein RFI_18863 [Reticulomyxa filosa]|uniref:Uncharacterized protein n=1 Tax=Reticulomyxa filosa TaxID=46433 RepID=X6MY68_RETFI|nr:hypothetical protein RFI_18863 [Reticulomyxa filosa]|eukprot:ETO18402.1 hypothetical protein RFI_18863 [Reticulomyxa filosa]